MRRCASLLSILVAAAPAPSEAVPAARPAVIAYVFPRDRVLDPAEIRAEKLTHVNFAFANVVGGRVVEGGPTRRREPEGADRAARLPPAPADPDLGRGLDVVEGVLGRRADAEEPPRRSSAARSTS